MLTEIVNCLFNFHRGNQQQKLNVNKVQIQTSVLVNNRGTNHRLRSSNLKNPPQTPFVTIIFFNHFTSTDEDLTYSTEGLSYRLLQYQFENILPKLSQLVILYSYLRNKNECIKSCYVTYTCGHHPRKSHLRWRSIQYFWDGPSWRASRRQK